MENRWTTEETACPPGTAAFSPSMKQDIRAENQASQITPEGWEPWLRKQIIAHPKVALGAGLLTGLLAGWWVKR